MKSSFFCIIFFLGFTFDSYCQDSFTETEKEEFEKIAHTFQAKYMDGGENCDYLLKVIDEDVVLSEIQFTKELTMTQEMLVQFCPHLPKKEVVSTVSEQRLLTTDLAFDYVSQLYLRKSLGDTVRETSARIWKKKDGVWKIIQLNNSLNKACD